MIHRMISTRSLSTEISAGAVTSEGNGLSQSGNLPADREDLLRVLRRHRPGGEGSDRPAGGAFTPTTSIRRSRRPTRPDAASRITSIWGTSGRPRKWWSISLGVHRDDRFVSLHRPEFGRPLPRTGGRPFFDVLWLCQGARGAEAQTAADCDVGKRQGVPLLKQGRGFRDRRAATGWAGYWLDVFVLDACHFSRKADRAFRNGMSGFRPKHQDTRGRLWPVDRAGVLRPQAEFGSSGPPPSNGLDDAAFTRSPGAHTTLAEMFDTDDAQRGGMREGATSPRVMNPLHRRQVDEIVASKRPWVGTVP